MFKGFYNLTSAMLTQGRMLDVVSNNMSNIATSGYKTDRYTASTFQDKVWQLTGNKEKVYTELGTQSFITAPSQLYTDYTQGSLDDTGQDLDFAIEGEGFFAIQTEDGERYYTRNGNFSLDNEGYLCVPGQGRVLGVSENPIQLITDKIKTDGYGGLFTQDDGFLGRIGIFGFAAPEEQLEKNDQGLFTALADPVTTTVPLLQGYLERSNTDLIQQMTEMISSERAYQSAAEIIKIYDQLINRVTTEVGRL